MAARTPRTRSALVRDARASRREALFDAFSARRGHHWGSYDLAMGTRRLWPLLAVVLVVPATASASSASIASARTTCRLTLSYAVSTAGTGDVFARFDVVDAGRGSCQLGRYPRLIFRSSAHWRLRTSTAHGGLAEAPGRKVTALSSGASAYFLVVFRPLRDDGQRCSPSAATVSLTIAGHVAATARLPQNLDKFREPINPCAGGVEVGRFAPGR